MVTLLFTDVEGSTKILHELGAPHEYAATLAEHRRLLREAFAANGGVEVDTQGDAFFVAFPTASGAVAAAAAATAAMAQGPIRVRIGLHTGAPHLTCEGYVGVDVHLAARIAAAGHGGQVLLSAATRDLVDAELTELGEHRLKDFSTPVSIFQLGQERFPPLKTLSNTNLPRPASSFVGREHELAEVARFLLGPARLVTVTGPGGSGKTRAAIEAAAELVPEFKAGVFWVPLAPLRDPKLVLETIAEILGAKDALADHINEREMLLLLDNLEQVIDAAPQLAELLEACRNLKLLVTSRELLRISGEVEYSLPPLADREAVALFGERSGLKADETIGRLCRRLDNLPLAIELAAARTRVLSPQQVLERLSQRLDLLKGGRDAEARQQTLRAAIEWSYDLLDANEQRLFTDLSVFRGGCTLDAAEEAAHADLDTLQSLVDKSLLRHTNERFWMLETIRDFAGQQLDASGERHELERRHAEWFLALAEESARMDLRWNPGEWLDRLEAEHDNFRAAFDAADGKEAADVRLRLVAALWRFWQMRGHRDEGLHRLLVALDANAAPTPIRARALNGAAALSLEGGDGGRARELAAEALVLHEAAGEAWGAAFARFMLGQAATQEEDWPQAKRVFEDVVGRFCGLGDVNYELLSTRILAWVNFQLGNRDHARRLHEGNLQRARAVGNRDLEGETLGALAEYALEDGRLEDAVPLLRASLAIARDRNDALGMAYFLLRTSFAAAARGSWSPAAQLLGSAEALFEENGYLRGLTEDWSDALVASARTTLGESTFATAYDEGRRLTTEQAVARALDVLDEPS